MKLVMFVFLFLCASSGVWANPENKGTEAAPGGMEELRGLDQGGGGSAPGVDWGEDLKKAEQRMALEGALQKAGRVLGPAEQEKLSRLMEDPGLTMEDRLTLLLTEIMQGMDRQIREQADKIQAIQQGDRTAVQGGEAPGVDREAAKLEKLTDTRSQVFNTLKSLIESQDASARSVLESMRDGGAPAAAGSGGSPMVIPVESDASAVKGSFSEAAGLESEVNPVEYRTGAEDSAASKEPASRSHVPNIVQKRQ